MKTIPFRFIRRTGASLVILLLMASCADTALAQNGFASSRSNGRSGGQSGQGRQVSVPRVAVAQPGQSGGRGITGVTRVTRMSESNQNARDFFRSGLLRLP